MIPGSYTIPTHLRFLEMFKAIPRIQNGHRSNICSVVEASCLVLQKNHN